MSPDRSTLLLADDDPTIDDSLAPFLERAGFHVLVVSDGVNALEKAQTHHPELIILDVLMPRTRLADGAISIPLRGPRRRLPPGARNSLDTLHWTSSLMPMTPSRIEKTIPPTKTASERINAGSSTARKRLTAICTSRS